MSQINQSSQTIAAAAQVLNHVIRGQSLAQCLPAAESNIPEDQIPFLRELSYGSCRWYFRLNALTKMLLSKPLKEQDEIIHQLIIVGLYQLHVLEKAEHAVVNNTVEACVLLDKPALKSMVNACLRRFQREADELLQPLDENPVTDTSHPKWLVKMLQKSWPDHWKNILEQNNQHPPFCIRVNLKHHSREAYSQLLTEQHIEHSIGKLSATSIYLSQAINVFELPGFEQGWCSVQDEAAQLSAELLQPQDNERILDLCAAPGGKTGHILESADNLQVTALDLEAKRLERVEQNLERLGYEAKLVCADGADIETWWDQQLFDRILLDAPCAAIGVVRRHPDIKMLRRREDIAQLADVQLRLLNKAWQMLKPGGRIVYATCSIMPQENADTIKTFIQSKIDLEQGITTVLPSKLVSSSFDTLNGLETDVGLQLFPQENGHDGFYYAVLEKPLA